MLFRTYLRLSVVHFPVVLVTAGGSFFSLPASADDAIHHLILGSTMQQSYLSALSGLSCFLKAC